MGTFGPFRMQRVQKEEEERAAIEQAQRLRMDALALEAAAAKKKRKSTMSRPQTVG